MSDVAESSWVLCPMPRSSAVNNKSTNKPYDYSDFWWYASRLKCQSALEWGWNLGTERHTNTDSREDESCGGTGKLKWDNLRPVKGGQGYFIWVYVTVRSSVPKTGVIFRTLLGLAPPSKMIRIHFAFTLCLRDKSLKVTLCVHSHRQQIWTAMASVSSLWSSYLTWKKWRE